MCGSGEGCVGPSHVVRQSRECRAREQTASTGHACVVLRSLGSLGPSSQLIRWLMQHSTGALEDTQVDTWAPGPL